MINVLIVGDEYAVDDTWTPRLIAACADLDHVRFMAEGDAEIFHRVVLVDMQVARHLGGEVSGPSGPTHEIIRHEAEFLGQFHSFENRVLIRKHG